MARKPISEKSIAENVLKHGTGGINIDECRVDLSEGDDPRLGGKGIWKTDKMANNVYGDYEGKESGSSELGRFPANVMHDGSEVVEQQFPEVAKSNPTPRNRNKENHENNIFTNPETDNQIDYDDEGRASRFFYVPKAHKKERNGSIHPTIKPVELMTVSYTHLTLPTSDLV